MPISAPGVVSRLPGAATQESQNGERLTAYLEDARGALSGNTVRAVRADLERFIAWCAEQGRSPLPACAATVVAYIEAMASVRAPATVRRYVSSVATVHKAAGERSPLEHVTVRRALKRMHRRKGRRQRQVQGLTWALRRRLMEADGDRVIVLHPVFWTSGRLKHQAALRLNFSRARAGVMYPCRWRSQPLL